MITRLIRIWGAALVLTAAAAAGAAAAGAGDAVAPDDLALAAIDEAHTDVLVFAAGRDERGAGDPLLALVFRPEPGWHVYWINPGDSGLPPRVTATDPGARPGALRFPIPERLPVGPLMNYGYEGETAFLLPLALAPDAPARLTLRLDWLVCAEVCVPESGSVTIPTAALSAAPEPRLEAALGVWRGRLPHALPAGRAEAAFTEKDFLLALALPGLAPADLADAYFFPETEGVLSYAAAQRWRLTDGRLLLVAPRDLANPAPGDGVRGLLVLTRPDGGEEGFALSADLTLDPAPVLAALAGGGAGGAGAPGFLLAFAFALVGGLLLNLMPCVFPVLSMKAMALLRSAGAGEAAARRDGLLYAAGTVAGFLLLAGVLLALKAAGEAVGWGFQLQEPWVIAALAVLMFLVGAHFIGWWRLPAGWSLVPAGGTGEGPLHSLFTGLLAAVVATPCTAPFMATAVGAAVVMPAPEALAVFAGLGFGLALPYLLVTHIPAARRMLPRPGPWMERLQQALAFPMWLTAVWLIWVLARLAGENAAAWLMAAIVALGFVLWAGRALEGRRPWQALGLAAAFGFLWLAAGSPQAPPGESAGAVPPAAAQGRPAEAALTARPWSRAAVEEARAAGRPVFVYFTADWCITCKVNEAVTLEDAAVRRALVEHGVAVFVADWTRRDAAIAAELARHGRDGVPLYLFYRPGAAEPEILPQILTPSDLLDRLAALPAQKTPAA
ncbi:MAG: thiol:disulfide interchange protein DsbD [Rhodothalassiaceae bacterium]|nr:MAG: thiol:disulfide interchange protein DsbD [Rhodothalassiaceae bacterium]